MQDLELPTHSGQHYLHQPATALPSDPSEAHIGNGSVRPTFLCRHCGAPMLNNFRSFAHSRILIESRSPLKVRYSESGSKERDRAFATPHVLSGRRRKTAAARHRAYPGNTREQQPCGGGQRDCRRGER